MSVLGGISCWEFKLPPMNAGFVLSQQWLLSALARQHSHS